MTQWEYRKSSAFEELAALGQEGWELVAALPDPESGRPTFYLKRPAPELRTRVTLDQKRRYYGVLGIRAPEDRAQR
jgi:hypothetical protein